VNSWIGRTLGKVQIELLIARGGVAEVYLGTHTTLQRPVAVKILRNQYEDDPDLLERFQREARVIARLRHPNIVQVFDFDTIDNHPYLVMEYVAGPSLSKYLNSLHAKLERVELPLVGRLLTAIASALQYAHDNGVIHRDVKPGNILLATRSSPISAGNPLPEDVEPVLTDFGLVRFLNSSRQTTAGQTSGTPTYMSPEQARGETTDGRTDIYSLGIVLYEILTGHVPFEGETTMSVLLKHINEPPTPIPGLSLPLQRVLDRALAKKSTDRYQTPNEFAAAFNTYLEQTTEARTIGLSTPTSLPLVETTSERVKRRRRWLPSILLGTIATILGAFLIFSEPPRQSPPPETATPTLSPIPTTTSTPVISFSLGPTGVLHFQDGTAFLDQVTMSALAMPAPPAGSQYEVWLIGEEDRLRLGILSLDANGKGTLIYNDGQNQNLLAVYDKVEITIRPGPDSTPTSADQVAYSFRLPEGGLLHVRHLLVSFPQAPDGIALIQGLDANTKLIDQAAQAMLTAHENNDRAAVRKNAESIMNVLSGGKSPDRKDWNGDGQITDPGDGYGFLLNGDNLGYIQAIYSHADYAVNSPDASQNMIIHGEHVKVCAQNLAAWAPQLRERVLTILTSASNSDVDQPVREAVALASQMLNGLDLDHNGNIEPTAGEGGALAAYEHAYEMADMPLLPVNPSFTPTAVTSTPGAFQTAVLPTRTSIRQPNTPVPPANNGNPTQKPKPTKKNPVPTKKK